MFDLGLYIVYFSWEPRAYALRLFLLVLSLYSPFIWQQRGYEFSGLLDTIASATTTAIISHLGWFAIHFIWHHLLACALYTILYNVLSIPILPIFNLWFYSLEHSIIIFCSPEQDYNFLINLYSKHEMYIMIIMLWNFGSFCSISNIPIETIFHCLPFHSCRRGYIALLIL